MKSAEHAMNELADENTGFVYNIYVFILVTFD